MKITEYSLESKDNIVCQIPPVETIGVDEIISTIDGMLEKYGFEIEKFVTHGVVVAFSVIKKDKKDNTLLWSKDA